MPNDLLYLLVSLYDNQVSSAQTEYFVYHIMYNGAMRYEIFGTALAMVRDSTCTAQTKPNIYVS